MATMRLLLFSNLTLTLFLAGCATSADQPEKVTVCPEPRRQMCTMLYDPVCGNLTNGQTKTYATDCTACSHAEVISFTKGACEKTVAR